VVPVGGFPVGGAPKLRSVCGKVKHAAGAGFWRLSERIRGSPLTCSDTLSYLSRLLSKRMKPMGWINHNDADLQTPEPQAGEQARVPGAHEDEGWPQGIEPSPEARSCPTGSHDRPEVAAVSPERAERLPRSARIRHSTEIRALLQRGKRKRTTNLDVFFTPSPASRSRLGLIVPKHGRKIVERNKLKRRLREIGRREVLPKLDEGRKGGDLLIRARRAAYNAELGQLRFDVLEAVEALCSDES